MADPRASNVQKTISPVNGEVYVERPLATHEEINGKLRAARHAFAGWRNVPLDERAAILARFCTEFEKRAAAIAEVSRQMIQKLMRKHGLG